MTTIPPDKLCNQPNDPPCPHEEHDHGICLECGADINDILIEMAEYLRP
jgi:hypothetical protein